LSPAPCPIHFAGPIAKWVGDDHTVDSPDDLSPIACPSASIDRSVWCRSEDSSTIVLATGSHSLLCLQFSARSPEKVWLIILSASQIVELHDRLTHEWHLDPAFVEADSSQPPLPQLGWLSLVASQHRANFELWHIEDEARAPGASDATLAGVKRRIDSTNQRRNDLAEQLDRTLLAELAPRGLPNPDAPLHSESPGLMIDRLSILALKIFHTCEELDRCAGPEAVPLGHAERNRERLSILEDQRADLAHCLDALWQSTLAGSRRFKLYRQLKMYNDPTLNPVIYRNRPV